MRFSSRFSVAAFFVAFVSCAAIPQQDRDWVIKYVRNNAKTFHVVELTMSIKDLTIAGNQAVAIVEQKSSRTFADGSGQHRLDVGAVQLETWQRSPDGWKLKAVRERNSCTYERTASLRQAKTA
jgi:hypothetical protein